MVKEVSIRKMSGNLQMRIAQILSEIREMGPVKIPTDAEIKRRAEESRRLSADRIPASDGGCEITGMR